MSKELKRPKPDSEVTLDLNPEKKSKQSPAPPYGSLGYWENRYRKQFQSIDKKVESDSEKANIGGTDVTTEDTLPFHEWYFSYEELRVIIMPLIVGGRKEAFEIASHSHDGVAAGDVKESKLSLGSITDPAETTILQHEEALQREKSQTSGGNSEDNQDQDRDPRAENEAKDNESDAEVDSSAVEDEEDEDNDSFVEIEDGDCSDDEDEDDVAREGLAKNGPISILEVGCGDVPLCCGLSNELINLQKETGACHQAIVKRIIATDYSSVVIEAMRSKYSRETPTLEFETLDARKMPYSDESFELILEKGLLDAMLSDTALGCTNCIQIVSECARLLSPGGIMVLVSHLNANTSKGMQWMENVVFAGLSEHKFNDVSWEIEVHGRDEGGPDDCSPAVYVVHKQRRETDQKASDIIPLKFYIY